ncbi:MULTISPECIES: hypothetical protein [Halorussus]|uniref:hypothetical protein n=1 Tax=Halorussus TaxID=1070314 RepID=UPI00209F5FD3|nr:hypothetical protein [Halorussus vallis]USZ76775.1 hypothetical protein NGM07_05470 [Halorussus vallis]
MDLALRLALAAVLTVAPTLLFVGLMRGLNVLRDDAMLARLAAREDLPPEVRNAIPTEVTRTVSATRSVETASRDSGRSESRSRGVTDAAAGMLSVGPIRSGRSRRSGEFVRCSTCGESNEDWATFCGECLTRLGD